MKAKLALIEASPPTSRSSKPFQSKNKGLVAETFDCDVEEVSNDKEETQVKVLMAFVDDELYVGKNHTHNGECIYITMKKRHIREPIWYLDSGCSRSMTGVKSYLHKYVEQPGPKVVFSDNSSCITEGYGSINNGGIVFTKSLLLCQSLRKCKLAMAQKVITLKFQKINKDAKQNKVPGLSLLVYSKDKPYSACDKGKHKRASFKTKQNFSIKKCLHLLHMDLFGPVSPMSINHEKYTLVIVDEYSRMVENQNDVKVKQIKTDNRTEFRNSKLESFRDEKGISQNFSSPYTPEQNDSRDQHIELVNIIGDLVEGMLTRSMAAKLITALASECLFAVFLFKIEPKKEEGIDYDKSFSPVARMEVIKIFLVFATYINYIIFQMDVKTAFLNGKVKEEVYVKQPPGFKSSEILDYVCKLDKALYGLKQAPKAWISGKSKRIKSNRCEKNLQVLCKHSMDEMSTQ
nr:retrovirus-related Pol polyprotein from transposon TNT 1-94 [Tanacetum cinerariifolium]